MLKVVLDANIVVSAILTTKGYPSQIVDLVIQNKLKLVISHKILKEIQKVLLYPKLRNLHQKDKDWINLFIATIKQEAVITKDNLKVNVIKNDPSDNIYLACAIEGKADCIISGDKHLTSIKKIKNIPILKAADFIEKIGF
jgi:hypothetical protein